VLAVLAHPDGTNLRRRDYLKLDAITSGSAPNQQQQQRQQRQQQKAGIESASDMDASQAAARPQTQAEVHKEFKDVGEPPFRVPPRNAIAGVLISDWAYGKSKL
jgi:NAD+ diphosphatase